MMIFEERARRERAHYLRISFLSSCVILYVLVMLLIMKNYEMINKASDKPKAAAILRLVGEGVLVTITMVAAILATIKKNSYIVFKIVLLVGFYTVFNVCTLIFWTYSHYRVVLVIASLAVDIVGIFLGRKFQEINPDSWRPFADILPICI